MAVSDEAQAVAASPANNKEGSNEVAQKSSQRGRSRPVRARVPGPEVKKPGSGVRLRKRRAAPHARASGAQSDDDSIVKDVPGPMDTEGHDDVIDELERDVEKFVGSEGPVQSGRADSGIRRLTPAQLAAVQDACSQADLPQLAVPLVRDAVAVGDLPSQTDVLLKCLSPMSQVLRQLPVAKRDVLVPRNAWLASTLNVPATQATAILLKCPTLMTVSEAELQSRMARLVVLLDLAEDQVITKWVVDNPVLLAVSSDALADKLSCMSVGTKLTPKQAAPLITQWMFS